MARAGLSGSEPGADLSAWLAKIMARLNGSTAPSRAVDITTQRPSQARPHSLRGKALSKRDDLQESRNIDIESDKTRSDGRSLRNFCAPPLGSSATEPIGVLEAYGARLLLCRVRAKWRRAALVLRPLWKALSLQASYGFN